MAEAEQGRQFTGQQSDLNRQSAERIAQTEAGGRQAREDRMVQTERRRQMAEQLGAVQKQMQEMAPGGFPPPMPTDPNDVEGAAAVNRYRQLDQQRQRLERAMGLAQPLPMVQDRNQLVPGETYMTSFGPATWNGSAFNTL